MHTYEKAFKGTVVNRAFPAVHGGTLKITLTVPFNQNYKIFNVQALASNRVQGRR